MPPRTYTDAELGFSSSPKTYSDEELGFAPAKLKQSFEGFKKVNTHKEGSHGKSFLLGYIQGLSGAEADELQADLTGKPVEDVRKPYKQAYDDHPPTYIAGEMTGGAMMTFLPGMGWTRLVSGTGVNAVKHAGLKNIAKMGGLGALIGVGASEADLSKGEYERFAKDVASTAAIGAGLQGGLSALGTAAGYTASGLRNLHGKRAIKAVLGQNKAALDDIAGLTAQGGSVLKARRNIERVGQDILDEPEVLGFFSKVEDAAPKLEVAKKKYGEVIGKISSEIDKIVPDAVDAIKIADDIKAFAEKIPNTTRGEALKKRVMKDEGILRKKGRMSFEEAQKWKNDYKYKNQDADALISNQDAVNRLNGIIGDEMENTAHLLAEGAPPQVAELLKSYEAVKSKYSSFVKLAKYAARRENQNQTNRFLSPSDYGVGGAAAIVKAMTGKAVLDPTILAFAATAAVVNKVSRERGSALAARTADKLVTIYKKSGAPKFQEAFKPVAERIKKGNPSAGLIYFLTAQREPETIPLMELEEKK